jgi:hypothetical protein
MDNFSFNENKSNLLIDALATQCKMKYCEIRVILLKVLADQRALEIIRKLVHIQEMQ